MKRLTYEHLVDIFSKARIAPYLEDGASVEMTLSKYHNNIVFSEAMFPALHYLEICLRNRLDQMFKKYFTASWLINPPCQLLLSEQDLYKINLILTKIKQKNQSGLLHDDVVAQMTFGFWCSFFNRKYDPVIWHRKDAIKTIFPNLLRVNRKRSYIEHKILKIKEIRNRIAHHEPIWNRQVTIIDAHNSCCELVKAISTDAYQMLALIDRFPILPNSNLYYANKTNASEI